MAISLITHSQDLVFEARVISATPSESVFDELEASIEALKEHIDSKPSTYYIALNVCVAGADNYPFLKKRGKKCTVDKYVPYNMFSSTFWDVMIKQRSSRKRLELFLKKVEDFSKYATRPGGMYYLNEHDDILFCQPLFFYLAMQHKRYIRHYCRMLRYWQFDGAGGWLDDDLIKIIERYGPRPSTFKIYWTAIMRLR
ncbi:hypothetical protein ACFOWX_10540 [Sphingorhabdus arenilitoris]|uniref:DUF1919 domain-containing protein n=1 Tax=Sphingorhabdus arenilitoris TaxID=1490041 RepID=A0ABV8RIZ0_9SPHN